MVTFFFFRERLRRPTHVLHSPLSPKKIRMLIHGKNDKILLIYLEHQCFIPFENCLFMGWSVLKSFHLHSWHHSQSFYSLVISLVPSIPPPIALNTQVVEFSILSSWCCQFYFCENFIERSQFFIISSR